jgi:hypothetical protein
VTRWLLALGLVIIGCRSVAPPAPAWPRKAKPLHMDQCKHASGLAGDRSVVLHVLVTVDVNGRVADVVVGQPADPKIAQAAHDCFSQWTFTPALDETGQPIESTLKVGLHLEPR